MMCFGDWLLLTVSDDAFLIWFFAKLSAKRSVIPFYVWMIDRPLDLTNKKNGQAQGLDGK